MNLALLSTYPVLEITNEIAPTIAEVTVAANVIFAQQPTVFVVKRFTAVGILYSLWFYDAGEAPAVVDDTSPYDPQSLQEVADLLTDTDDDGIPDVVDADVGNDGIMDSTAGAQAVPLIQDLYTGPLGDHMAENTPALGSPPTYGPPGDDGSWAFQEELGVDDDTLRRVQILAQDTTLSEMINEDILIDEYASGTGLAYDNMIFDPAEIAEDDLTSIGETLAQLGDLGYDISSLYNAPGMDQFGSFGAALLAHFDTTPSQRGVNAGGDVDIATEMFGDPSVGAAAGASSLGDPGEEDLSGFTGLGGDLSISIEDMTNAVEDFGDNLSNILNNAQQQGVE